ncbi:MAG: glycoside hydrolase family 95 protein [Edaphobacter sp.]
MNSKTTRRRFLALSASAAALLKLKPELFAADRPESAGGLKPPAQDVLIYFDQPAPHWVDALPVGNGRLGGMVFGGVKQERIALNEDTLWSGYPKDWNNPEAKKHLPVVRDFVLKNKDYKAADEECRFMQGPYSQAYQPLGDLLIDFEHGPKVTGYRRELNLDEAVTSVSYQVDGVGYGREVFVSAPAQVVVARLTCSKPGGLNGRVSLTSALRSKLGAGDEREILLQGKAPEESAPNYLFTSTSGQHAWVSPVTSEATSPLVSETLERGRGGGE